MAPSAPMGSHTHVRPVWHLGPHHKLPHSTWAQKPAELKVQKTLPKHKSALLQPHATQCMPHTHNQPCLAAHKHGPTYCASQSGHSVDIIQLKDRCKVILKCINIVVSQGFLVHSCTIMVQPKLHPLPICPPMPTLLSYPTCPLTTPNPQPPLLAAARSPRPACVGCCCCCCAPPYPSFSFSSSSRPPSCCC